MTRVRLSEYKQFTPRRYAPAVQFAVEWVSSLPWNDCPDCVEYTIVKDMTDLSPSSRRELYARYFALIAAKFSPDAGNSGQGQEERGSRSSSSSGDSGEERKRREKEEQESRRRKEEEQERRRWDREKEEQERKAREENDRHQRERSKEDSRTSFSEEPVRSQRSKAGNTVKWEYTFKGYTFSFSPAGAFAYLKTLVEPGSLLWYAWEKLGRAFRCLPGAFFGVAVSSVGATLAISCRLIVISSAACFSTLTISALATDSAAEALDSASAAAFT